MDRDEAIRRAEIAMKWAEGEAVQFQLPEYVEGWNDQVSASNNAMPRFFDPEYKWRLKPKPLELWIALYPNGSFQAADTIPPTDTERELVADQGGRWMKFREVANETDD